MTVVTSEEIALFRSALSAYQDALIALDAIEDCEGDLEDAALVLAIDVGQQPDSSDWLDGFAKRYRPALCEEGLKESLLSGSWGMVVEDLMRKQVLPMKLMVPVLMYVMKQGVDDFCEPLEFKI